MSSSGHICLCETRAASTCAKRDGPHALVCSGCHQRRAGVFTSGTARHRCTRKRPLRRRAKAPSGWHRTCSIDEPQERGIMSDTATVLIVDDDETSREYLSALLDALGFGVEGVA